MGTCVAPLVPRRIGCLTSGQCSFFFRVVGLTLKLVSQPKRSSRIGLYVFILRECDSSKRIAGLYYLRFFPALLGKEGQFQGDKGFLSLLCQGRAGA